MFTHKGRGLLARKLSGVSDSCFDYMSIGIGARPVTPTGTVSRFYPGPMTAMKHEVLRVPVISALPLDSGTIKCVAEVPASFTCEFTEVALWTHRENAASNRPQSQPITTFSSDEKWTYTATGAPLTTIASVSGDNDFAKHEAYIMANSTKAMFSPSDDLLWTVKMDRRPRKEGFRLGTSGTLVRGDLSNSFGVGNPATWTPSGDSITLPLNGLKFDQSAPSDELQLTYFASPTLTAHTTPPTSIKLSIQFLTVDGEKAVWNTQRSQVSLAGGTATSGSQLLSFNSIANSSTVDLRNGDYLTGTGFAQPTEVYGIGSDPTMNSTAWATLTPSTASSAAWAINAFNFQTNSAGSAYFSEYTKLSEANTARSSMTYTAGFKWANVVAVRIFVDAEPDTWWIGLDSLRFVNTDDTNSTYGMVAYDVAYNFESRGIQTRVNSPTNILFEVMVNV